MVMVLLSSIVKIFFTNFQMVRAKENECADVLEKVEQVVDTNKVEIQELHPAPANIIFGD